MSKFPTPTCSRCGSKLILLKEKVEKSQNQQSPTTTVTYKCTNKECQAAADKKMAELLQRKKDLEALQAANAQAAAEKKAAATAQASK